MNRLDSSMCRSTGSSRTGTIMGELGVVVDGEDIAGRGLI
jgi:hypothetical protein